MELWRSFELGEFSGDFDDLFNDLQCVLNFAEVNVLDELFGLFVEVISFAGEGPDPRTVDTSGGQVPSRFCISFVAIQGAQ